MCQSLTHSVHQRGSTRTLRPKDDTDSVREDVDALEDARAALIRELDLLLRTPCESGLRAESFCRSAAEGARGGVRDGVHRSVV